MQLVKEEWIKLMDRNSTYSYFIIKHRAAKAKIINLVKDDGSKTTDKVEIKEEILSFVLKISGEEGTRLRNIEVEVLLEGRFLDQENKKRLMAPFSYLDVKKALFDIEDFKAPEEEGYNVVFLTTHGAA